MLLLLPTKLTNEQHRLLSGVAYGPFSHYHTLLGMRLIIIGHIYMYPSRVSKKSCRFSKLKKSISDFLTKIRFPFIHKSATMADGLVLGAGPTWREKWDWLNCHCCLNCDGNIRRQWLRLNWALFGLFLPAGSFFSRAAGANTGEKLIEASGRIFTSLMVSCILRFGGVV